MNSKENNSVEEKNAVDKTKRRLSVAGMTSPILLGLTSKTVWGASATCTTSGQLSGNASPGGQPPTSCDQTNPFGVTPGFWGNHAWPTGTENMLYSASIFSCRPVTKVKLKNTTNWITTPTLKQVFDAHDGGIVSNSSNGTDNNTLKQDTFHAIAAYLNALTPTYAYPFSVDDITTRFCLGGAAMDPIKDFEKVIHSGADAVKQWLIDNNMYNNGLVG